MRTWGWSVAWVLLTTPAAAQSTLADPATAPRPRRVDVQVLGEGIPGIEASLRESLGRIALELKLERQATPTGPRAPGALAQVWVALLPTGGAALIVRDEVNGRVLEQQELDTVSPELLVEQLTLLIRTAIETRLESQPKRGSVGDFAALPSGEGSTDSAAPVGTAPASVTAPPAAAVPRAEKGLAQQPSAPGAEAPQQSFGVLDATQPGLWDVKDGGTPGDDEKGSAAYYWGLEPGAGLRWWSPDLPARRAFSVALSAELRDFSASPGVQLGFGYYESAVSDSAALSFDIETQEMWIMGTASLLERSHWDVGFRSGPTLLWSVANVRSTAAGYDPAEPRTHWDLVWRNQVSVRYWLQPRLALGLTAGLDYDASPAAYGVSEGGIERTIAREGELRPAVSLTLSTGFGAAR